MALHIVYVIAVSTASASSYYFQGKPPTEVDKLMFMLDAGYFQNNVWDSFLSHRKLCTSYSKSLLEQMCRRQISLEASKCHAALLCADRLQATSRSAAKPARDQGNPLSFFPCSVTTNVRLVSFWSST
jgi:hypothetical protein